MHLDAQTITMLSDYVSAQLLPPMMALFLPSNSGTCGTSSSGTVRSLEKMSILPTLLRDPLCAKRKGHQALQQVLEHSSLNVTTVYLQFNDQDIKELYDKTHFSDFNSRYTRCMGLSECSDARLYQQG
ncbi:MAG: hypothetical protein ABSB81_07310 [Halobacteriota archaeon]